jgi:HK97 family phage prohead protease
MDHVPPIIDGEREARCATLTGIEVRANDDGSATVAGYAAVFDSASEDLGGFVEEIKQGAFRKVLRTKPDVRFLVNHDGLPMARTKSGTLRLSEDPKGLKMEADLDTENSSDARELVSKLERGDVDQMSFMFRVATDGREWFFPDDPEELARRVIYEICELYDVSAVTFPAYPATEIGVRGVIAGEPIADAEGRLDLELFAGVCERVHEGALEASVAERRELDRAAERLETVTPWQRERALRGSGDQPEGAGEAASTPVESTDAETEGESYGLAARSRRLARIEREFDQR